MVVVVVGVALLLLLLVLMVVMSAAAAVMEGCQNYGLGRIRGSGGKIVAFPADVAAWVSCAFRATPVRPLSTLSCAPPPIRTGVCTFFTCFCSVFCVFFAAGRAALPQARAGGRGLDG